MAEGRMLKRNISESRRLAELQTDQARLLWTWMMPYLDSEGRFHASPDIVKGKVVPRLKTFTEKNIGSFIKDMARLGLIILYEVDGELLLQYRNFDRFQNIKKDRESAPLPGPSDQDLLRIESGSDQDQIRIKSQGTPEQLIRNIREVKRRDVNIRAFEIFWNLYPKKKAKADAEKAWKKINPDPDLEETIISKIKLATQHEDWIKDDGKFIPYPASWLNGKRWQDDLNTKPKGGNGSTPPQPIYSVCPKCKKEVLKDDCFSDNCIHCAPRLKPDALKSLMAGFGSGRKAPTPPPEPDIDPNDIPFD